MSEKTLFRAVNVRVDGDLGAPCRLILSFPVV